MRKSSLTHQELAGQTERKIAMCIAAGNTEEFRKLTSKIGRRITIQEVRMLLSHLH